MRTLLLITTLLLSCRVCGHDARPNYLQIEEAEPLLFNVSWKAPASLAGSVMPTPVFPEDCTVEREPVVQQTGAEYLGLMQFRCAEALSDRVVGLRFPVANPSLSTLIQLRLLNGQAHRTILDPSERQWRVPQAEQFSTVALEYTWLGVEHIWGGIDHLLFVACLVFIARKPRRLLITITGFTVAHSLTLAVSALDLLRLPTPPVEAVIALSVVFLAREIVRADRTSLTYRFPGLVSSAFGLLHGFGFASVLRDIGLPQTEVPAALLFFNVGVEVGQLLFLCALVGGYFVLLLIYKRGLSQPQSNLDPLAGLATPASYAVGITASFWLFDRLIGFWA